MSARARAIRLSDRGAIEARLRRDVDLNLYSIGDLDDFFWPRTAWYGLCEGAELREIALVYAAVDHPTVLALTRPGEPHAMRALLVALAPALPARFSARMSPGVAGALSPWFRAASHGEHEKMALRGTTTVEALNTSEVVPLGVGDAPELLAL